MRLKANVKRPEQFGCKCYHPGDPEFEALASLVTPLHKIRAKLIDIYNMPFVPYEERERSYHGRRNESVDVLYTDRTY